MKVVLHLGQHKTGSKALQSFLSVNRDQLKAKGILYPLTSSESPIAAYRNSHFKLFELLNIEFLKLKKDDVFSDKLTLFFQSIEAERSNINADTIIFSAEDLFDMQTAHDICFSEDLVLYAADRLQKEIIKFGWMPVLVVYLRRPDYLIYAQYAQYIKGHSKNTLSFSKFYEIFSPRLDSFRLLEIWNSKFENSNIIIRPYENSSVPNGIVLDFFQKILKLSPSDSWKAPVKDIESSNITPDWPYIQALRLLNKYKFLSYLCPRKAILKIPFESNLQFSSIESKIGLDKYNSIFEEYKPIYKIIAKKYADLPENFFLEPWQFKRANEVDENFFIDKSKYIAISIILIKVFIRRITEIFFKNKNLRDQ